MAVLTVVAPNITHYPAPVEFKAYVSDLRADEYVDFVWTVDRPELIHEIPNTKYSGKFMFSTISPTNLNIIVTALIYKIDANFNKITQDVLIETTKLYPVSLWKEYVFDLMPPAPMYDSEYEYQNELETYPLEVTIWRPMDRMFELPYYYPVVTYVTGGVPPYTYSFQIEADNNNNIPEHEIIALNGVCSLVFPKMGVYWLKIKIQDSIGNVFEDRIEIKAYPVQTQIDYLFDMQPYANIYDSYWVQTEAWSPPTFTVSKTNNYYVGKYRFKIVPTEEVTMADILSQISYLINRNTSPRQMWERYYASRGYSFYGTDSRVAIYYPGKMAVTNLYLDEHGHICFNLRVTSDFSLPSATARMLQAMRWVIALNNLSYEVVDYNFRTEYKTTVYSDTVMTGLKDYIEELVATKYARVELDNRYEAIQTDIDVYLNKKHLYENNGRIGYPLID